MITLLLIAHRWEAYATIAWMLASAAYGLALHRRSLSDTPPRYKAVLCYKAVLFVGEGLLVAQVLLGLSLLASGLHPASLLHIVIYGALSPLLLPGAYLYARQQGRKHPYLAFGLVSLFLFAFLIRGTFTG